MQIVSSQSSAVLFFIYRSRRRQCFSPSRRRQAAVCCCLQHARTLSLILNYCLPPGWQKGVVLKISFLSCARFATRTSCCGWRVWVRLPVVCRAAHYYSWGNNWRMSWSGARIDSSALITSEFICSEILKGCHTGATWQQWEKVCFVIFSKISWLECIQCQSHKCPLRQCSSRLFLLSAFEFKIIVEKSPQTVQDSSLW
jgi:hypothetical protein